MSAKQVKKQAIALGIKVTKKIKSKNGNVYRKPKSITELKRAILKKSMKSMKFGMPWGPGPSELKTDPDDDIQSHNLPTLHNVPGNLPVLPHGHRMHVDRHEISDGLVETDDLIKEYINKLNEHVNKYNTLKKKEELYGEKIDRYNEANEKISNFRKNIKSINRNKKYKEKLAIYKNRQKEIKDAVREMKKKVRDIKLEYNELLKFTKKMYKGFKKEFKDKWAGKEFKQKYKRLYNKYIDEENLISADDSYIKKLDYENKRFLDYCKKFSPESDLSEYSPPSSRSSTKSLDIYSPGPYNIRTGFVKGLRSRVADNSGI